MLWFSKKRQATHVILWSYFGISYVMLHVVFSNSRFFGARCSSRTMLWMCRSLPVWPGRLWRCRRGSSVFLHLVLLKVSLNVLFWGFTKNEWALRAFFISYVLRLSGFIRYLRGKWHVICGASSAASEKINSKLLRAPTAVDAGGWGPESQRPSRLGSAEWQVGR